jgi:hypothetical protein
MNFEPIDAFLTRVKQLSRTGSKDMRLSFQEANLLAISLAELLAQLNKAGSAATSTAGAPAVIDGGTFKDRKG